jgi:hypothetical protein
VPKTPVLPLRAPADLRTHVLIHDETIEESGRRSTARTRMRGWCSRSTSRRVKVAYRDD